MTPKTPQADIDFVKEHYRELGPEEIAQALGKTVSSIKHIAYRSDITLVRPRGPAWTAEDMEILKRDYPIQGAQAVAQTLERSVTSVRHRASRNGIVAVPEAVKIRTANTKRNAIFAQYRNGDIKDSQGWKRLVLSNGDYTCADCGLREPAIMIAHHNIPSHDRSDLRLDPDNGVVLCPNCHARRHVLIGRDSSGSRLTSRDQELILELRQSGQTYREIAETIGVNHKSVITYLNKM